MHDNWEYRGGYKRKTAPSVTKYLFFSNFKIKANNKSVIIRYNKKATLKEFPATTSYVFFIKNSHVQYLLTLLKSKKTLNSIKELISQLASATKTNIKDKIEDKIYEVLLKILSKSGAKVMKQFLTISSIDVSYMLDMMILNNNIKRVEKFKKNGKGVIFAKCTYLKDQNVVLTLQGVDWYYIESWDGIRTYNITKSAFYITLI